MTQEATRPQRGWLFREVIGPGLLLACYCAALMALLPEGINRRYVMVLAIVACVIVAGAVVVSVVSARARRSGASGASMSEDRDERRHRADAWLLLLPLAPVVQYIMVNRETVSPLGGVLATGSLAAVAALLTLAIPYLVRHAMSPIVVMMVGVALAFVIYNMASFAQSNRWYGPEDAYVPLAVFATLVLSGVVLYRFRREGTYVFAGVYFLSSAVIVPLISEPPLHAQRSTVAMTVDAEARDEALATIARGEADRLPDIIMLTYDSYVENETMLQHGIDNAEQEAFLETQGFDIERGMYTVAADSIASMGRVLGGTVPGHAVAGDSPLLEAMRATGYETSGVFENDYLLSRADPAYDRYFPEPQPIYLTMLRGILEGRFRHDLALQAPPDDEIVDAKHAALVIDAEAPQFVYVHGGPGHSQNSGVCLGDETERFAARLAEANLEMRDDIATVLEHRPDAIVIVNGDHGPFLTKNCVGLDQYGGYDIDEVDRLDIQDRFGAFLAIRWPHDLRPANTDIEVLQDVLPAVLGAVFPDLDSDALRGSTRLADRQERVIAGVNLEHGLIQGGALDGEPLFETHR